MKSLAALALLAALLVPVVPAAADVGVPVTPAAAPAGYTGPAIFGMWPQADTVTTIPIYARADRRWGVRRVVRQWNAASSVQLILTATPCEACPITITQHEPEAFGGLAGWARMRIVDGVIERCDIELNKLQLVTGGWAIARRRTVAHELGHCLGLGHSTENKTVMGDMSGLDGPTALDLEWVGQLYGPPPA